MTPDDERLVALAIRESFAAKLLQGLGAAVESAATTRRLRRIADHAHAPAHALIRAAGAVLAAAALTHAVLLRLWPAPTVGRVPLATSIVCSLLGLCAMVVPTHIAAAWRGSATRRAWARIAGADR